MQVVSDKNAVLEEYATNTHFTGINVLLGLLVNRFYEECSSVPYPSSEDPEECNNNRFNNDASARLLSAASAAASTAKFFDNRANLTTSDFFCNNLGDNYVIDKKVPTLPSKWKKFNPDGETALKNEVTSLAEQNMVLNQQVRIQAVEI